jgi:isopenicillin N synthase-like dioxygenase
MPLKQQKLSFRAGSSSSEKRPGDPTPDAAKDFKSLLSDFMAKMMTMNNDMLDTVRTELANRYEMFIDVLQQQNNTIAKLQVSRRTKDQG